MRSFLIEAFYVETLALRIQAYGIVGLFCRALTERKNAKMGLLGLGLGLGL